MVALQPGDPALGSEIVLRLARHPRRGVPAPRAGRPLPQRRPRDPAALRPAERGPASPSRGSRDGAPGRPSLDHRQRHGDGRLRRGADRRGSRVLAVPIRAPLARARRAGRDRRNARIRADVHRRRARADRGSRRIVRAARSPVPAALSPRDGRARPDRPVHPHGTPDARQAGVIPHRSQARARAHRGGRPSADRRHRRRRRSARRPGADPRRDNLREPRRCRRRGSRQPPRPGGTLAVRGRRRRGRLGDPMSLGRSSNRCSSEPGSRRPTSPGRSGTAGDRSIRRWSRGSAAMDCVRRTGRRSCGSRASWSGSRSALPRSTPRSCLR